MHHWDLRPRSDSPERPGRNPPLGGGRVDSHEEDPTTGVDNHRSVNSGSASSIEQAEQQLAGENINIAADAQACQTPAGQAAILTAATTAARAVGRVFIDLADPGQVVVRGPFRQQVLGDVLTAMGGDLRPPAEGPLVQIGSPRRATDQSADIRPVLTITWDGWTAAVRTGDRRLLETGNQILAPIAAAALAVHEAFAYYRGRADGARRDINLPLWDPSRDGNDSGPTVHYLPPAWHLVGLGHLGQALRLVDRFLALRLCCTRNTVHPPSRRPGP